MKYPEFVTALALVAPQTLLFQRNARYYSSLILLDALLIWHVYWPFKSTKLRYALAIVIVILFFHSHPLAAACSLCGYDRLLLALSAGTGSGVLH